MSKDRRGFDVQTRSQQLRESNRRVLRWSLVAAAVLHALLFLLAPEFTTKPLAGSAPDQPPDSSTTSVPAAEVDVLFGPPTMTRPDGTLWTEADERVLQADRAVVLPMYCDTRTTENRMPMSGRVRLRVKETGRVDVEGLAETTGDACGDAVLKTVAASLWYRWIPNEDFPAPLRLTQPITLARVRR